jgi:hypothetical protein
LEPIGPFIHNETKPAVGKFVPVVDAVSQTQTALIWVEKRKEKSVKQQLPGLKINSYSYFEFQNINVGYKIPFRLAG